MPSAIDELIDLAGSLVPTGEIGDGMVARFQDLAKRARAERGAPVSRPTAGRLSGPARHALHYLAQYATDRHGAIVHYHVGAALVKRGLAVSAPRWRYARAEGICLRLTDAGEQWVKERT